MRADTHVKHLWEELHRANCCRARSRSLILRTLATGPNHGFAVARRIQQISRSVLRVEQGSLYPALHRMELDGLIESYWGTTENNRKASTIGLRVAEPDNWPAKQNVGTPSLARSPPSCRKGDVPGWLTRWFLRVRATLSVRHDQELRDELQLHLNLLAEEYIAQGIPPDLARRRARREFGNPTRFQEASHALFSFRLLEEIVQDLRYAVRESRRSPGFTCIAVSSLAVGIGALTATFAVVDAFMLRGLPVRSPERLVAFSTSDSSTWGSWPYASFLRWRNSPDALFEVAAASDVRAQAVPLRGSDKPGEVLVTLVSANYFQVMGVDMTLGRTLADTDTAASGVAAVAVISDAFWKRWFGGTPDVLAKTIDLHGVSYAVVGVARKRFTGHSVGHPSDVWVPITMQSALMPDARSLLEDRWGTGGRWLKVIGRLGAGVSVEQATTSAHLIQQRFVAEKAAALGEGITQVARERKQAVSLLAATTGYAPERARYVRPLMILSGITTLVLLVACANFTNLMLARSESRRREFVIRLALGGGTWRLIRQSATECILLARRGRISRTTVRKLGDHGVPETVRSHDHARRVCPRARWQSPDVRERMRGGRDRVRPLALHSPGAICDVGIRVSVDERQRSGAQASDRRARDAHHSIGDVHGSPDWRRTAPAYCQQSQISGARVRSQRAPGLNLTGAGRLR